ncbi:MAG TPA: hypothetical protein PLQ11_05280 [Beijerinckiaceae bacterium]|nr:hypothetical protein [Beijerinckiaceae bacterium]
MKRFVLAAASVLILATAAGTASAQYYDPYRPAPPRYDPYDGPRGYDPYDRPRRVDPYRYDRPPPRDWGYRPPRRQPMGNVCVTSRGACNSYLTPIGTGCRCNIPGFGLKRGTIQ